MILSSNYQRSLWALPWPLPVRGAKRIRSGVPGGTELRHKTGTGNNAVNDVGLMTLPAKHGHIALAVMISDSKLPTADQERAVADVAKIVYEGWGQVREQARASR